MQKLLAVALGVVLLGALVGCGGSFDGFPSPTIVSSFYESVVQIQYLAPGMTEWSFTGTGWVVTSNGIMTARHVLDAPPDVQFRVRKWEKGAWSEDSWPITEIILSEKRDLAFAEVPNLELMPLLLSAFSPKRGESVWSIGAHWYGDLMVFSGRVIGFVPDAEESAGDYVTDSHIANGCSGGPVIGVWCGQWRVVGVNVGMSQRGGVVFTQAWVESAEEIVQFLVDNGIEFLI